jgi:hypothetical protein
MPVPLLLPFIADTVAFTDDLVTIHDLLRRCRDYAIRHEGLKSHGLVERSTIPRV